MFNLVFDRVNRKIPIEENCHSQEVYGFFPMWQFVWENWHIILSYSYQTNLVSPPNKIFGLQKEAREKIKQEETKVLQHLSKLPNLFVRIEQKISQDMFIETISSVSDSQRKKTTNTFQNSNKFISPFQIAERQNSNKQKYWLSPVLLLRVSL